MFVYMVSTVSCFITMVITKFAISTIGTTKLVLSKPTISKANIIPVDRSK